MADSIIGNPIEGSTRRANAGPNFSVDSKLRLDGQIEEDFDTFFDEHWRTLSRLTHLLSPNPASAEEFVTTALSELYARRHRNDVDLLESLENRVAFLASRADTASQPHPPSDERDSIRANRSLDALSSQQRVPYALEVIERWSLPRVSFALKQTSEETERYRDDAVQLLTDSNDQFRLDRSYFEKQLRDRGSPSHTTSENDARKTIRLRAELTEAKLRRRNQIAVSVGACFAVVLALVGFRSARRESSSAAVATTVVTRRPLTFDSVANTPMRFMPTWLPSPGSQASVVPIDSSAISNAPNESSGYVGVWGSGLNNVTIRVIPKVVEFPIGMFRQPNRPDSLDKAAALGPSQDFWDGDDANPFPVVLSWASNGSVVEVVAPPGTPWAQVVLIARSVTVNSDQLTFSVDSPPFELDRTFLGRESEIQPVQKWFYRMSDRDVSVSLSIERLTAQGQDVRRAQTNADSSVVRVRGKDGYTTSEPTFSYSVRVEGEVGKVTLSADRFVRVSVSDGDWLIEASGRNERVETLVRVLDGLRQVDEFEWEDLVASANLPAGETLTSMRSPTRVVSVGEVNQTKWTITAAQLVTRDDCLTVRIDIGNVIGGACVPIGDRVQPNQMPPTLLFPESGPVALVFTEASVETVIGPIGNVPVDRVVAKDGQGYANFGVAVVALPQQFTKLSLQQLRRSSDGRLVQIEGPTISRSADTK